MTSIRALPCAPWRFSWRFSWSFALAALLLSFASHVPAHAAMTAEPVTVVELFTSQGCSSCPPADAFLGELAERKGLLVLSFHVDYWNYMGWKDPFSSPQMTHRQRTYAQHLGQRYVYTPQMVVDGAAEAEGGARAKIEALLVDARKVIDKKLPLRIGRGGINEVKVILPARKPMGKKSAREEAATDKASNGTLWLVAYDDKHTTEIKKGENRGKTLSTHNVVRSLKPVATWKGKQSEVMLNLAEEIAAGYQNCAVLLQAGEGGPIIAAARLPMPVTGGGEESPSR
jgi:hypothetical protein